MVCGGAPCQGLSLIGQRAIDDPRNMLVKEFVRLVCELDARASVFENVKGLTLGQHRKFLDELITAFGDDGYQVTAPTKVLNAKQFGVPQSRERLFLIGTEKGERRASYPAPVCSQPTCADALGDIPDAETFACLMNTDQVKTKAWGKPSACAATLPSISRRRRYKSSTAPKGVFRSANDLNSAPIRFMRASDSRSCE